MSKLFLFIKKYEQVYEKLFKHDEIILIFSKGLYEEFIYALQRGVSTNHDLIVFGDYYLHSFLHCFIVGFITFASIMLSVTISTDLLSFSHFLCSWRTCDPHQSTISDYWMGSCRRISFCSSFPDQCSLHSWTRIKILNCLKLFATWWRPS